MDCVEETHAIANAIAEKDYEKAMELRGSSFQESFRTLRTMLRALPHPRPEGQKSSGWELCIPVRWLPA